jgi:toxin ParE1/3/4
MVAGRIVISRQAERDLDDLFDYIARDASVDRAEAILRRIGDTLANLAFTPMIGRVRPDLVGEPRSFAVWPWLILYEPLPERSGVLVLRVVDGRRDLDDL